MHVPGVVLGHEFAGVVHEVGEGVDDVAVGSRRCSCADRVVRNLLRVLARWPQLCRRLGLYGGYRLPLHGGLAPLVAVSRRSAFTVPDGLGVVEAALAEPMAVAVHAVRRARDHSRHDGADPRRRARSASASCRSAMAAGARTTIVTELSPARRAAAARVGATAVIDPRADDPRAAVRDLTGHGVDVVFETTANDTALRQGLQALRPRGTLVSVAGWGDLARVDMGLAMAKEVDIRFTMTYEPAIDFPATLAMLASGAFAPTS